jgi:cell division protein FtsA
MARHDEIIVGLDVGTTKVCAIVGEVTDRGLDIIGIGTHASEGLRKGTVVNIESTTRSIQKAIEEAELMAGCEVSRVHLALSGSHVLGFNSHGIVAVKDREVSSPDVDRVLDAAKAVAIPRDRIVVHTLPQEFVVDENDGIKEPRGISGVRLEARVHIVTAVRAAMENVVRCCNQCGLEVVSSTLAQLASSEAVLHEDEKELGVALIDIGGGTTDIAVWYNGSVIHSAVLPLGGNHLTNDIAVGMRTPRAEAEKIKIKYGCALNALIREEDTIEVPSVGGREPQTRSRRLLGAIIEPRMEEIFTLVQQEIQKSGFEDLLASGAVITGGVSAMEGATQLAEEVLGLPVRPGIPGTHSIGGLVDVVRSARYSTAVGLVLHASQQEEKQQQGPRPGDSKGGPRWWGRFRSWARDVF